MVNWEQRIDRAKNPNWKPLGTEGAEGESQSQETQEVISLEKRLLAFYNEIKDHTDISPEDGRQQAAIFDQINKSRKKAGLEPWGNTGDFYKQHGIEQGL